MVFFANREQTFSHGNDVSGETSFSRLEQYAKSRRGADTDDAARAAQAMYKRRHNEMLHLVGEDWRIAGTVPGDDGHSVILESGATYKTLPALDVMRMESAASALSGGEHLPNDPEVVSLGVKRKHRVPLDGHAVSRSVERIDRGYDRRIEGLMDGESTERGRFRVEHLLAKLNALRIF